MLDALVSVELNTNKMPYTPTSNSLALRCGCKCVNIVCAIKQFSVVQSTKSKFTPDKTTTTKDSFTKSR